MLSNSYLKLPVLELLIVLLNRRHSPTNSFARTGEVRESEDVILAM